MIKISSLYYIVANEHTEAQVKQSYTGSLLYIPGKVVTEVDGGRTISLVAAQSVTVKAVFGPMRTAETGRGSRIDAIAMIYKLTGGNLASVTPTLVRVVNQNSAAETRTVVPLTAAAPAFTLVANATNSFAGVNLVTNPTFDSQVDASTVVYEYTATIVAAADCTLKISSVEVKTTLDMFNPLRYSVSEYFEKKPGVEADLVADLGATSGLANLNFFVEGTNATAGSTTLSTSGGAVLTTAGADNDQVIVHPHDGASRSSWGTVDWGTENQTEWECAITTGAAVTTVLYWAGLKLTPTPVIATDADQLFFRFDTDIPDANWQIITSIGNVDTTTDSGVPVAVSTMYRLKITIDSSRIARFYINDVLEHTTTALTDAVDFLPFVGVQALAAAARTMDLKYQRISRVI